MGSNFTEASTIAARAVTSLTSISVTFDKITGIHPESVTHSTRTDMDDENKVFRVIKQSNVLSERKGRHHSNFPKYLLTHSIHCAGKNYTSG